MDLSCENIIKNFLASTTDKIRCDENFDNKFMCSNTFNQICELNANDKKIIDKMSLHSKYFDHVNGEKNKKKFILICHNKFN